MILTVDLPWILDVAREAGQDDPAPTDYGVAISAVERHKAVLTDPGASPSPRPVYDGVFVRAAALTHTLGRLRWLERSNVRVAIAVAHGYLLASGVEVKIDQTRVTALAVELRRDDCTAESITRVLKTWAT
ncbi:fic family toxin-antitoxin system, toxin component [Streptomyces abikoensis]|uniref:fic family toxin-antitoxin system, toxin component n=1 Tax=Streptomyces abikoensis TaxID=97398 RepID=UPI0033ECE85F